MSHDREKVMITMLKLPVKKQNSTERKQKERSKRKSSGQAAITIHVDEKHRLAVRTFEAILNSGGALAERIERVIKILNDKLPEKRRARLRLPKVKPDAARAALSNLIKLSLGKRAA